MIPIDRGGRGYAEKHENLMAHLTSSETVGKIFAEEIHGLARLPRQSYRHLYFDDARIVEFRRLEYWRQTHKPLSAQRGAICEKVG
jgi:hypothetical protein